MKFFIKNFYLFIFRGEGKEKQRETSMCGCLSRPPPGDLAGTPGLCPDWESHWRPFSLQSGAVHWATPAGALVLVFLKKISSYNNYYNNFKLKVLKNVLILPKIKLAALCWTPISVKFQVSEIQCLRPTASVMVSPQPWLLKILCLPLTTICSREVTVRNCVRWYYLIQSPKNRYLALASVAQLTGYGPTNGRVEVFIPGQGTRLVFGSGPIRRCMKGNQSMFLSHINVSFLFFLPPFPSFPKSNEKPIRPWVRVKEKTYLTQKWSNNKSERQSSSSNPIDYL